MAAVSTLKHRRLEHLGLFCVYFLLKAVLLYEGAVTLKPWANLALLAAILLPLGRGYIGRLKRVLLWPAALALLYHESFLPGLSALSANEAALTDFDLRFVLSFLQNAVNFHYLALTAALILAFMILNRYLRLSFLSLAALTAVFLTQNLAINEKDQHGTPAAAPATFDELLLSFYAEEQAKQVLFPKTMSLGFVPFDLILINICSLAPDDLAYSEVDAKAMESSFDLKFERFNSVTSYSGPATLRLLRSLCGQAKHSELYSPKASCELFTALENLKFKTNLYLDHDGHFGAYLEGLRKYALLNAPLADQSRYPLAYKAFDGAPVYSASAVFDDFLRDRQALKDDESSAVLFNLVALHDGNSNPDGTEISYQKRAQKLLKEIQDFVAKLSEGQRNALVILVPEHGAALRGDSLQLARLRDIPSPYITNTAVLIKFIKTAQAGVPANQDFAEPKLIPGQYSYEALGVLIARVLNANAFSPSFTAPPESLTSELPQTRAVRENAEAVIIEYEGRDYLKTKSHDWLEYRRER